MASMTRNSKPVHAAVVGLQWGDEGKGKIVDLLTPRYEGVVRYNGGANAGHTVVTDSQRYALHLIPSGILYPDKLNVIGNGVVINPATLIQEIDELQSRGIEVGANLRISNRAHLVFPYHERQDALLEAAASAARGENHRIGTTGRGIGPAYADKAARTTAIRVCDLYDRPRFAEKLRYIVTVKNAELRGLAELGGEDFEPYDAEKLAEQYKRYADRITPHVCDTAELLHRAADQYHPLLFEGANACMLDIDHGTYPYVTSSNCSSLGIYPGSGVPGGRIQRIVGVVKAYTTRVGGGPFPTELRNETGEHIRERGSEYGTTTGRPRRCGYLDLMALRYAARLCGATELAITLLDVLSGLENPALCVGYRYRGRELEEFPAEAAVLSEVEPRYEMVEGFNQSLSECRNFEDLPSAAGRYIQRIEEVVGVPVRIVSVGPDRAQTLFRETPRTPRTVAS